MLRPRKFVQKTPKRVHQSGQLFRSRRRSWVHMLRRGLLGLFLLILDLGLLVWLSISAWALLSSDPYFAVRKITIHGQKSLTAEEIIAKSKIGLRENIFKTDILQVKHLLESERLFERVEVWRQLPDEIFIDVVERQAVAQLVSSNENSKIWLLDRDGIVVAQVPAVNNIYPVIRMDLDQKSWRRGYQVKNNGLSKALKVLDIFSDSILKKLIELDAVEVRADLDVLLKSINGLEVNLGQDHFEERLIRLLSILEDLKKKNQDPSMIDLRFRYVPVVLKDVKTSKKV